MFGEVMAVAAPSDDSPVAAGLLDVVFAEIWSRPGLSRRDRRFVTLACVAGAEVEAQLGDHVRAALRSGDISITEMREAVLQFAVYAVWPKASRFGGVVEEQWRDIGDDATPAPEPLPGYGPVAAEEAFRTLNCDAYVPDQDNPFTGAGVLDFVYGELWQRPGLGVRERRLITVTCAAVQGASLPIISHVYAALKSRDISFAEMDELALHFAAHHGWPKASQLGGVIAEQQQRVLAEWRAEDG